MLKIRILDNYTGIITTRNPREVHDEINISFSDAPADSTAIFITKDNVSFYRTLYNGACSLPLKDIKGIVKVRLKVFDSSASSDAWECEGFEVKHLSGGGIVVFPDDTDTARKIVELKLENQALRKENRKILDRIANLDKRLEHLYEGYDIT